jgi:hypothetical protein
MYVDIEDWDNGWYGISIGIDPEEIDHFIDLLRMIKENPDQHFHIQSDYQGAGGVGDIEISARSENKAHNMSFSSRAYLTGETIDIG